MKIKRRPRRRPRLHTARFPLLLKFPQCTWACTRTYAESEAGSGSQRASLLPDCTENDLLDQEANRIRSTLCTEHHDVTGNTPRDVTSGVTHERCVSWTFEGFHGENERANSSRSQHQSTPVYQNMDILPPSNEGSETGSREMDTTSAIGTDRIVPYPIQSTVNREGIGANFTLRERGDPTTTAHNTVDYSDFQSSDVAVDSQQSPTSPDRSFGLGSIMCLMTQSPKPLEDRVARLMGRNSVQLRTKGFRPIWKMGDSTWADQAGTRPLEGAVGGISDDLDDNDLELRLYEQPEDNTDDAAPSNLTEFSPTRGHLTDHVSDLPRPTPLAFPDFSRCHFGQNLFQRTQNSNLYRFPSPPPDRSNSPRGYTPISPTPNDLQDSNDLSDEDELLKTLASSSDSDDNESGAMRPPERIRHLMTIGKMLGHSSDEILHPSSSDSNLSNSVEEEDEESFSRYITTDESSTNSAENSLDRLANAIRGNIVGFIDSANMYLSGTDSLNSSSLNLISHDFNMETSSPDETNTSITHPDQSDAMNPSRDLTTNMADGDVVAGAPGGTCGTINHNTVHITEGGCGDSAANSSDQNTSSESQHSSVRSIDWETTVNAIRQLEMTSIRAREHENVTQRTTENSDVSEPQVVTTDDVPLPGQNWYIYDPRVGRLGPVGQTNVSISPPAEMINPPSYEELMTLPSFQPDLPSDPPPPYTERENPEIDDSDNVSEIGPPPSYHSNESDAGDAIDLTDSHLVFDSLNRPEHHLPFTTGFNLTLNNDHISEGFPVPSAAVSSPAGQGNSLFGQYRALRWNCNRRLDRWNTCICDA